MKKYIRTAKVYHTGANYCVKVCLDPFNSYTLKFDSKGDALRCVDQLLDYQEIDQMRYFLPNAVPTWG